MRLPYPLLLAGVYFAPSTSALDLLSPKTPKNYKIGAYMAIGVGVVMFAAAAFYLGLRRGRTGTWLCWRDGASPTPNNTSNPIRRGSSRATANEGDWEKNVEGHLPSSRAVHPSRPSLRPMAPTPAGAGTARANSIGGAYGYPVGPSMAHFPPDLNLLCEAGYHTPRRQASPAPPSIRSAQEMESSALYEMGSGIRSTEMVHCIKAHSPHRASRKRWSSLLRFNSTWSASSVEGSVPPPTQRRNLNPSQLSGSASLAAVSTRSQEVDDFEVPISALVPLPGWRLNPDGTLRTDGPSMDVDGAGAGVVGGSTNGDAASTTGGGMNWEGLEWARRLYRQRGSMFRASWRLNGSLTDLHGQRRERERERERDPREMRDRARGWV